MKPTDQSVYDVRFVAPDDPDYIAFMLRMADRHPSRGGPRAAGEMIGGLVEGAVRHHLSLQVPLQPERILAWTQRTANGRHATLYREIDAVWKLDAESYVLFEVKLTTPENIERGSGIKQLNASADLLFTLRSVKYVLKRLVYVSATELEVLDGLPGVEISDEYEELGVIWVSPDDVHAAAHEMELTLPEDWFLAEAREGAVYDPAREAWREHAHTEMTDPASTSLAAALKRAMQPETTPPDAGSAA